MFIRVEILLQLSITFVTQLLIIKILDLYNKISNPRQTQGHAFGKKTSRAGLYALNTRRRHAPATVMVVAILLDYAHTIRYRTKKAPTHCRHFFNNPQFCSSS